MRITLENEDLIASVPLFTGLTKKELAAVGRILVRRTFSEKQTIIQEMDDDQQTFFIILSGKVHVTVSTSDDKQSILATLKRGDFFGEMTLLDGEPRSASIVAVEPCSVVMLYRQAFVDMLTSYPKIAVRMLATLSRRLRQTNRQIGTLSMMSVYGRVADVLVKLGREQGEKQGTATVIVRRPTHQQLADMAGTTRETVSRIMSTLQKKRYIIQDSSSLVILDEKKLYD